MNFWVFLACDPLALFALCGLIFLLNKSKQDAIPVRVEYFIKPLESNITLCGIGLTLTIGILTYFKSNSICFSNSDLICSSVFFIASGMLSTWTLLGMPNVAGKEEVIQFTFRTHWDLIYFPFISFFIMFSGFMLIILSIWLSDF